MGWFFKKKSADEEEDKPVRPERTQEEKKDLLGPPVPELGSDTPEEPIGEASIADPATAEPEAAPEQLDMLPETKPLEPRSEGEYRVYVGTYAKYNNGDLKGEWVALDDFADAEEFDEYIKQLHSDEEDPEFMYQDQEGFPKGMVSETSIDESFWEWKDMEEGDRNMLGAYREGVDAEGTLKDAQDAYSGSAESDRAFAEEWVDSMGGLSEVGQQTLEKHFDWDSFASELAMGYSGVEYEGETYYFHG